MTYITILWITILSGPMEGSSYGVIYYDRESCRAAMTVVGDTLDYDHSMQCEVMPMDMGEPA